MNFGIATTTLEQVSQASNIASAFFALLSLIGLGYVAKFTYIIKRNNIQKINNFTILNGNINGNVVESFISENTNEVKK